MFEPPTVTGHQLAPGQYKLTWDGSGSSGELMTLSHGQLMGTVPARLIELGQAGRDSATESQKIDDGSQSPVSSAAATNLGQSIEQPEPLVDETRWLEVVLLSMESLAA